MSTFAGDLVAEGIAALRSGAREQAQVLLARATALEPQHEQAWLWLSGAVTTAAERQQCLERVLTINPASQAARRGLALLGAAPPEPAAQPQLGGPGAALPSDAPALHTAPAPQPAVVVAPAAQADPVPVFALPSLFSDPAQPVAAVQPAFGFGAHSGSEHSFALPSIFSPPALPDEPIAAAPQQGAPAAAPGVASGEAHETAVPPLDAALLAFIVKRLGQSRARDDTVRAVIGHIGCSWPVAEQLVREVMVKHRGQVVKSRRPRTILIGSLTLLGGIALIVAGGIVLASFADGEYTRARALPRAVGMVGVGLVMILGSLIGMWQDLRG